MSRPANTTNIMQGSSDTTAQLRSMYVVVDIRCSAVAVRRCADLPEPSRCFCVLPHDLSPRQLPQRHSRENKHNPNSRAQLSQHNNPNHLHYTTNQQPWIRSQTRRVGKECVNAIRDR